MKQSIILITAVMMVCCHPKANNEEVLQSRIDSLEATAYKPGFGEFMGNIQVHHAKLWFAGQNKNWELADFEINEINENLEAIKKYCTDRPETKSISIIDQAMDSISIAIAQKNPAKFNQSYINLTTTCNTCHQATSHQYNVIKIPDTPPFSNQDFKPKK
jgi:hypothetical protein